MPRAVPAVRIRLIPESISLLNGLQMARSPRRNENYESQRRALHTAIQDLRQSLSGRGSREAH